MSQRAHSAGALTCSSLGLERPVVASDLARGVASRGASLLLLVPVLLATVATERMRLIAAFSLSLSSLRLYNITNKQPVSHQITMRGRHFPLSADPKVLQINHLPLSLTNK